MGKTAGHLRFGVALLLCVLVTSCSQQAAPTPAPTSPQGPIVRVKLLPDQKQVTLAATQPPLVRVGSDAQPKRLNVASGVQLPVTRTATGWALGNVALGAGEITILPAADGSLSVNGKPYRGRFRFVPTGAADSFDVINDVDIDGYLKSVVPKEMFADWHPQAYQAQAIVARTYALWTAKTSASQEWDLFPDTRSQVYGGLASETAKSQTAVDETAGIVVAHGQAGNEKIFKAYFSACCGGVTQSAWDAFGEPYSIPLSERNVGPVCNVAPRFNWGPIVVKKDELTKRFRAWRSRDRVEKNMQPVQTVRVSQSNRYGRPVRFEVVDVKGNTYSWRSEELRWAVNAEAAKGTTLNSSFCKIVDEGDSIRFLDGHGHGHGVGMCQWCAQTRALAGWPHENIVLSSFPASKLVRAY